MRDFLPVGYDSARYRRQSEFCQGYVTAMFFTLAAARTRPGQSSLKQAGEVPETASVLDIVSDSWQQIIVECREFRRIQARRLGLAMSQLSGYGEVDAGGDFWLTRNGEGSGYWDRGLDCLGIQLTEAAKREGVRFLTWEAPKRGKGSIWYWNG